MPLEILAPELLYTTSKRPICKLLSAADAQVNQQLINSKLYSKMLPVSRYTTGKNKGLYHGERPIDVLGVFYFLEPESTTVLTFNTHETYRNKYEALVALDPDYVFDVENIPCYCVTEENYQSFLRGMRLYFNGDLSEDLMLTPSEVFGIRPDISIGWTTESISRLPQERHTAIGYLSLYALGHELDQQLCLAVRNKGIDVLVLQDMFGTQLSTEIMDTRSVEDSFASLQDLTMRY